MFLYDCIGNIFSSVNNTILSIINKCTYFVNNSQIIRCLNKEYMYDKYCNITIETCNCIQNSILYKNSIYTINYNLVFVLLIVVTIILFCCKKKRFIIINNSNISLLDEDDTTSNIVDSESLNIDINNNYVIDKNDTLPKYNDIDKEEERNSNQITIVELPPPKYIECE
jgi:hypothetical protein